MKVLLVALFRVVPNDDTKTSSSSSSVSQAPNAYKAIRLAFAEDLSSFSFFQRGMVKEHLHFASRTVCEKVRMCVCVCVCVAKDSVECGRERECVCGLSRE
jgi:hypothetical protein